MKRWFTGFMMSWGMFLAIPCPCRIWDEKARPHMVACLPLTWDAFVISREIGSGVVPLDAAERRWREVHGAVLQGLAARAEHVSRIFCGLEERLK